MKAPFKDIRLSKDTYEDIVLLIEERIAVLKLNKKKQSQYASSYNADISRFEEVLREVREG